jgi:NTE family protein
VRVNPIRRDDLPRTAREILNRVNEISFNSSLLRELRAIGFITRLIDQGLVEDGALKRVYVHGIDAEDYMAGLGYSSKLNPSWDFLVHLRDIGRESAARWLDASLDRLGVESSLDIDSEFPGEASPRSRRMQQRDPREVLHLCQHEAGPDSRHPSARRPETREGDRA